MNRSRILQQHVCGVQDRDGSRRADIARLLLAAYQRLESRNGVL